ncbi:MAG: mechanosensitive ion channel family protein [Ignavibacteriaceae bacterium]|jgi:small-conductance mechanosensitive channel|nr:mechanosensitive ion channel family protein [Ignavibacteriaceae bacterium]
MKSLTILYLLTIYLTAFVLPGEYNKVFAQQDSNSVITVTKTIQDTVQKNENQQDTTLTNLTEKVGLDRIRELISFEKIIGSLFVLVVGFFLLKIITKILEYLAEKSARHRISYKGTIPIVRLLGWAFIFYIVIAVIIQLPFETIIAVSASLAIAIGLAAQDLVKNVIGGIMILFDRPFQVGDKIQVGDNYGEVLTIGLRSTRIVTGDDSVVSIPNSDIMTQSVSNSNSGEPNCQVVAEVYLPIDIDTVAVRDIALEVARVSKYVYLDKQMSVLFFNEVKEKRSFLKMRLKAYVMDIRYEFAFKSEMTELIIRELLNAGVLKKEDVS